MWWYYVGDGRILIHEFINQNFYYFHDLNSSFFVSSSYFLTLSLHIALIVGDFIEGSIHDLKETLRIQTK